MNDATTTTPTPPPAARKRRASIKSVLWFGVLLLMPLLTIAFILVLRDAQARKLASRALVNYGHVPSFQLTNQEGQPFGSEQLQGKIWIASFIFTTCPGPCPMISSRMSGLQKPLKNTDVHLVSFTVDPETDTPEVLREYAAKLKARPGHWDFLTGQQEYIFELMRNGFKLAVGEGDEDSGGPIHTTRAVLVDRTGAIRGYYDMTAGDVPTKLAADAHHLLRDQPAK
ncbi:MAG: SCO family protein [Chthoniobacterales bacterium]|nr:SCO family protein [Chthoniobacterales bacterium]